MNLTQEEYEKLYNRMIIAREEVCSMSEEQITVWAKDLLWITEYLYDWCPPKLSTEGLDFFETLMAYKYSFDMNGEKPPQTNMKEFGPGTLSDKYMPNWMFSFWSIVPLKKEVAWSWIFNDLHRYKYCLDSDLKFSEWEKIMTPMTESDYLMLFSQSPYMN